MASVDELWAQVVESPDDLAPRLVLADALIEAGDPRGELIALQCRGADANVLVGNDSITDENVAERVSELIAANWLHWLGDAARLLVRQGSTFVDGMLSVVQVGSEFTDHAAWSSFRGHRELCAIYGVRPFKVRADHYASFLAGLTRDPHAVDIHAPLVIRNLRTKREHWGVRHVRFGGIAWWSARGGEPGLFASELRSLSEMSPQLETLDIPPSHSLANDITNVAPMLPRMFPQLRRLRLEETHNGWLGENEPLLRALPFVVFD